MWGKGARWKIQCFFFPIDFRLLSLWPVSILPKHLEDYHDFFHKVFVLFLTLHFGEITSSLMPLGRECLFRCLYLFWMSMDSSLLPSCSFMPILPSHSSWKGRVAFLRMPWLYALWTWVLLHFSHFLRLKSHHSHQPFGLCLKRRFSVLEMNGRQRLSKEEGVMTISRHCVHSCQWVCRH